MKRPQVFKPSKRKQLPSVCLACSGVGVALRHSDGCRAEQAK